jgi:hypothetical protein
MVNINVPLYIIATAWPMRRADIPGGKLLVTTLLTWPCIWNYKYKKIAEWRINQYIHTDTFDKKRDENIVSRKMYKKNMYTGCSKKCTNSLNDNNVTFLGHPIYMFCLVRTSIHQHEKLGTILVSSWMKYLSTAVDRFWAFRFIMVSVSTLYSSEW